MTEDNPDRFHYEQYSYSVNFDFLPEESITHVSLLFSIQQFPENINYIWQQEWGEDYLQLFV